ncbi:MAG: hypothetical protein ABI851_14185 [Saprospiraceae bacterium]
MKKIVNLCAIALGLICPTRVYCQTIPPNDDCLTSPIFSSLGELIGTLHPMAYSNPNGPNPLCPGGGIPINTGWYSFTGSGGHVNVSLTFSNCSVNGTGVQIGVYKNCDFTNSLICNPQCNSNGTYSFGLDLDYCEVYSLFINGCNGDICDVQLNVTGALDKCYLGGFEAINFDNDHNLEACINEEKEFFVDGGHNYDKFEWTIDKIVQSSDKNKIKYKFTDKGDFEICVSKYRLSAGGIRYGISGKQCSIVHLYSTEDQVGVDRSLCYDDIFPIPFNWHGVNITKEGIYHSRHVNKGGCSYDSIVQFNILPKAKPIEIFHIGTNPNNYYVNPKGILIRDCSKPYEYSYKISGTCAEYLEVNQFIPSFKGRLEPICVGDDKFYYAPIIEDFSCKSTEGLELEFTYYLKDLLHPNAPIIKSNYLLEVNNKSDYSFSMDVDVYFGTENKKIHVELGVDTTDEAQYLSDGGRDIQTKNLFTNLNASNSRVGYWRFKSGPGMLHFDQINDPKTKVSVNTRGVYYVEWLAKANNCTYADEVKLNFATFYAEPNKKKVNLTYDEESSSFVIRSGAEVRFSNTIENDQNPKFTWFNLEGKTVGKSSLLNNKAIHAPAQPGLYILQIEEEGSYQVLRVLVIE